MAYGLGANRATLETFAGYLAEQSYLPAPPPIDNLFTPIVGQSRLGGRPMPKNERTSKAVNGIAASFRSQVPSHRYPHNKNKRRGRVLQPRPLFTLEPIDQQSPIPSRTIPQP